MNEINNQYQPNDQTIAQPNKIRIRLMIAGLIVVLVGIILALVFKNSDQGSLVVNSNATDGQVTLKAYPDLAPKVAKITSKTYGTGQSISLPAGTYIVSVKRSDLVANKIVEINSGEETDAVLNLNSGIGQLEPVGTINANQFSAGSSRLYYLDSQSNNLFKIDNSNGLSAVNGLAFSSIHWANSSFGIAQDAVGTLYSISNGSVSALNNLPSINTDTQPTYTVAPNQDIYIAYGKNVYVGRVNSQYKLIYTASAEPVNLFASNKSVAVVTAPDESNIADQVAIVTKDGGVQKKLKFGGQIAWSPSGNYFFANSQGPDSIFNSSFGVKVNVPSSSPKYVTWRDDENIYYAEEDQIWKFNVSSGVSSLIAKTGQDQTVAGLGLSDNGSYLYVSVSSTSGSDTYYGLYRHGLMNQRVSTSATQINGHLPWLVDGCFLGLINFTRPTISINQGNAYDGCTKVAKNYVSSQGINQNDFDYRLSSVLPSTPSSQ